MSAMAGVAEPDRETGKMASVVFAGSIGTIIEWYDFLIYGTAATLVFNTLFFPNVNPTAGMLASLGTYAVGFFARPIGGALFGHFGDRIGRKTMLMLTMVVMALGTFLVGCLPTYDQIGIWAPILLVTLRFVQGIGLGGEWGGASLMVLEHAPAGRRAPGDAGGRKCQRERHARRRRHPRQLRAEEAQAEQDPGRHRDDPEKDHDPDKAVHIRTGVEQKVRPENTGDRAARADHRNVRGRVGKSLGERRRGPTAQIEK